MRYVLNNDDDGHWYILPADKKEEFSNWVYGPEDAEQPEWARSIGGHPNNVTFAEPEIFGKTYPS